MFWKEYCSEHVLSYLGMGCDWQGVTEGVVEVYMDGGHNDGDVVMHAVTEHDA